MIRIQRLIGTILTSCLKPIISSKQRPVPQLKRETMWIELLEGIPAKEAELLDLVRKGENPFKNISKEIVKKAFPDARIN